MPLKQFQVDFEVQKGCRIRPKPISPRKIQKVNRPTFSCGINFITSIRIAIMPLLHGDIITKIISYDNIQCINIISAFDSVVYSKLVDSLLQDRYAI